MSWQRGPDSAPATKSKLWRYLLHVKSLAHSSSLLTAAGWPIRPRRVARGRSGDRAAPHLGEKGVEEPSGIVRARGRLGMVLHTKDRKLSMPQPLDRAVVQVDVRHLQRGRTVDASRRAANGKTVILRRDGHDVARELAHRMIPAPMPVRHLRGPAAVSEGE